MDDRQFNEPHTGQATAHQAPAPGHEPAPAPVLAQDGAAYSGYTHPGSMHTGVPRGAQQMQVAAKSPAVAALASFFLDGLGQMLNGEVGKGVMILVGMSFGWLVTYLSMTILIGFLFWPVMACLHIWQVYDAYKGAQKWNLRHGIIS